MDYTKASDLLSDLEITIKTDHLLIEVLWCRVMTQKNDWMIKRHKHHSFEFHFCASGSSRVEFESHDELVREGMFYLTSPGVYHAQGPGEHDHYMEYALNCNITLLDDHHNEGMAIYTVLENAQSKVFSCQEILPLFEMTLSEITHKKIGYYNKIISLITLILIESTRTLYDAVTTYQVPQKFKNYDGRYHLIYKYIQDHILEKILVSDLSAHIHLSEKQVNRIVKSNAKMTVKQLIDEMKMTKSKEYLMQTDLQINEISDEMNFSSVYYFDQFFKKNEGVSPSAYRRMSQNLKKMT